ncbi:hypothetical protein [Calothrix sp. PCC 6303]|uniref:hypothetical protein n=1 Tax=Calothrix sp. PCC 6303 TaxID=1170562 RepID=UPI0002A054CF|nr:hypothetical protein [Calothrix sp. PCC 6303]AFZ00633.1 hypothetical protein Cal6303_1590 [Calothrix sp. PCC 6303]
MKHKYLCLIFTAISFNFTLFTTSSFAQTPTLQQNDETTGTVNFEKSVSVENEDAAKVVDNSDKIVQAEAGESIQQPQASPKYRIPIQSRVFMAPIMQQ